MNPMRIDATTLLLSKDPGGGQDAAYPPRGFFGRASAARFAVADGATHGTASGVWAGLIAQAYVETGLPEGRLRACLDPAVRRWHAAASPLATSWIARNQLAQGDGATLAGLSVRSDVYLDDADGTWSALLVGDCCLFIIEDDHVVYRAPPLASTDFSNCTVMLASNPGRNDPEHRVRQRGTWRFGQVFYLTSDALGCWCVRQLERGGAPWRVLDGLVGAPAFFEPWIRRQQRAGQMTVDDVVLTRIVIRR